MSQERIRDELVKILISGNPARGCACSTSRGFLLNILPEIEHMKGVEQPPQYHPEGDVYVHTLLLLDGLSHAPIELAMGALLHDVAKPATFERAPDRIRFHGHDKKGADMSRVILRRLAFPNEQIDLICSLVNEHLRFKDAFQMRVSTLKRFFCSIASISTWSCTAWIAWPATKTSMRMNFAGKSSRSLRSCHLRRCGW